MTEPLVPPDRQLTRSGDPDREAYVRDLLATIVDRIQAVSDPLAVYLQGSFARGEGVVEETDGELSLFRDLDVVLVYRFREDPDVLHDLREDLVEELDLAAGETSLHGAEVSLAQLPLAVVTRWRDLKTLELAERSLLLAGHRDVRPEMAVGDGDVPVESGERFLLQKAIGLVLVHGDLRGDPQPVNYEVSKLYVEATQALAAALGTPSLDFEERVEVLETHDDPEVQALGARARDWGSHKVEGRIEALADRDAVKAWEQGRADLRRTLELVHAWSRDRGLDLATDEGRWAYYEDLSKRLVPRTAASLLPGRWPPGRPETALGRLGKGVYSLYLARRLGTGLGSVGDCPLSLVYVGALSYLSALDPDGGHGAARESARPYLDRLEARENGWDPQDSTTWEDLYFRVAKPLYGSA